MRKFNDQSDDVGNLKQQISEMGGLLVYNYEGVRDGLNAYYKDREKMSNE